MTTFIILTVVAVAFIVMLGAVLMCIYFGAALGGAIASWVFGVKAEPQETISAQDLEEIDRLVRRTRKAVCLPPLPPH
ncbi:hypothetical protein [Diaphorobacter sp.]|uniref:hypothetical protein n=1 Tax=Diaphorobacter sp. TaxID=1934310 RepID=UPI003D112713